MNIVITRRPLDAIDQKIVNELTQDARLPIATLARRVSLSRNAVRQRVEKLERNSVITGYTVRLGNGEHDRSKIIALVLIYRRDRMRGADVTTALKKIPEVRFCYVLSGKFDLVVQIEAYSQDRLTEICKEIWGIPGVNDTRTTFVLSIVLDRT